MSHAWWLTALVVSVALSGCAGGDGGSDDTAIEDVEVDGTIIAADKGILAGRVFSDTGNVVPDARVFVPGSPHDVDTGTDGRFRFVNVTAGKSTLRVEADGFQVHERIVDILPATVLHVNVTLLPLAGLGASYLPHMHDFWRGRDQITIFDEDVDLREKRVGSATADHDETANYLSAAVLYANKRYPRYIIALPELEDGTPALVYPGAERVEVTLTWNDGPPMPPTYAFGYRPADRSDEERLPAGPSGTKWTIEVGPLQADNGHQRYTMWEFYIIPDNEIESAPNYRPAVVTETVHLTIEVFRGDEPPVEPPHPRFWEQGDQIQIRSFDNGSYVSTGVTVFGANPKFLPMDGRIVPPGTARLVAEVVWAYAVPTAADIPYELYYHTALSNPAANYFVRDWPKAVLIEDDAANGRRVFEIELKDGEADGYYQQRSAWRFAVRPEGYGPDGMTPDHYRGRSINLDVVAHKAPGVESE